MNIEKRSRSAIALPDDLFMEILNSLPALDVLKCRGVCRKWRELISNQHFQETHLKAKANHSSMILIHKPQSIKKGALRLLDKWGKSWKRPTIRIARPTFIDNLVTGIVDVKLSYAGLIVMESFERVTNQRVFTIFNPISGDAVKIEIPEQRFEVIAMFFNPLIKEYCILFLRYKSEFLILNLGAQPCCRALEQPAFFVYIQEHPVVIEDDATIYWQVYNWSRDSHGWKYFVMSFDIKTEKFTFIPLPDAIDDCDSFHIIKTDGRRLSLAQCTTDDEETLLINIWTLKDSAARLWTKTHSFSINMDIDCSTFMVIAIEIEELLLHSSHLDKDEVTFYAYNFERRTVRKIRRYKYRDFSIFVPSFVSLKNCKPRICI